MEEEAESSEARRGQSFGNSCHIPLGKGPISIGQGFSVGFFWTHTRYIQPMKAEQLASSKQLWRCGWGQAAGQMPVIPTSLQPPGPDFGIS